MRIGLLAKTARSAVFELKNDSCYYTDHPYSVTVNGKMIYDEKKTNVFSLFRLIPDTRYEVTIRCENPEDVCTDTISFTTNRETAFVDVTRFHTAGDGITDDTMKLQAALMACPKGGTVYVPEGTYLSYSLFLPDDITVYLDEGCTILGGTERAKYPVLPGVIPTVNEEKEFYLGSWEGNPLDCFAGLINVLGSKKVSITGQGVINANADKGDWYINHTVKRIAWRPRLFFTNNAEDVLLHGVKLMKSYSWTIHPLFSENISILDVNIENDYHSPNTDGINPECCRNVHIIGNRISVGDDCVTLKSGKFFIGRKLGIPCENIKIQNCLMQSGHGGLVIGSEMSGGVKNITLKQCIMENTDRGVRIKSRRGRGRNAVIEDLFIRNVKMKGVYTPFVVNMFYYCDPDGKTDYVQCREPLPVDERTPYMGAIRLEHIEATDASYAGCYVIGLPEAPIRKLTLRDVKISFAQDAQAGEAIMAYGEPEVKKMAFHVENVEKVRLENVILENYEGKRIQIKNVGHFEEV